MIKKLAWGLISIIAAFSIAVVVGIVHPREKVNALWLISAAGCFYAIAYRFDGVDYHPTNRWVLFGHHFAAIAGAGPLIGPMLAAQFGYLPGFLWILIGAAPGGGGKREVA